MPKILERAPQEVDDLLETTLQRWHGDLLEAEPRIACYFAWVASDSESGADKPALTLHGYPCAAIVKITSYEQRVKGVADATITIDKKLWDGMSERERLALLDHEASHLELARDKEGFIKSDDLGRPKFKMRLHDVEAGWFTSVAERHREHSAEIQQARNVAAKYGQLLFGFAWTDYQARVTEPVLDLELTVPAQPGHPQTTTVSFSSADLKRVGEMGKKMRQAEATP